MTSDVQIAHRFEAGRFEFAQFCHGKPSDVPLTSRGDFNGVHLRRIGSSISGAFVGTLVVRSHVSKQQRIIRQLSNPTDERNTALSVAAFPTELPRKTY